MLKCPYCEAPLEAGLSECPSCQKSICYVDNSAPKAEPEAPEVPKAEPEAASVTYSAPEQKVQFVKKINPSLSNGVKVFLSVLTTVFGLGQIITFIASIVFMCSSDNDRKSFGCCLMIATVIMFVLSLIALFALILFFSFGRYSPYPSYYKW